MGIRAISRIENVCAPLLIHWIRSFAKAIKEKLRTTEIPDNAKEIEILEADELFTYYQKKTKRAYIWLAVDQNRNQAIDIAVSKSRDKFVFVRMAQRLQRKGYKAKILCSDGYEKDMATINWQISTLYRNLKHVWLSQSPYTTLLNKVQ
ncbi:DDE-type integrase/transposase/recombinase [Candidatus Bandiella euplotis]|nr:DDE-type integrase/transposase/recombinase [Candidatus Bandiella woodruffii]